MPIERNKNLKSFIAITAEQFLYEQIPEGRAMNAISEKEYFKALNKVLGEVLAESELVDSKEEFQERLSNTIKEIKKHKI